MKKILSLFAKIRRADRLTLLLTVIFLVALSGSYFVLSNKFFAEKKPQEKILVLQTPSPSPTPTVSFSTSPTTSPTAKPVAQTPKPAVKTPAPTSTPKSTSTSTPSPTPTPTPSPSPTPTPTPTPQVSNMTINGSAHIKAGEIAPGGSQIEVIINGKVCGSTTTREVSGLTLNFTVDVKSLTNEQGCGNIGDDMTFRINGTMALQHMPFNPGYPDNVILNVSY